MINKWARRLAILLALCLLVNNCISGLPMTVKAAEGGNSAQITASSGDAEPQEEVTPQSRLTMQSQLTRNIASVSDGNIQNTTSLMNSTSLMSVAPLAANAGDSLGSTALPATLAEYLAVKDSYSKFFINSLEDD